MARLAPAIEQYNTSINSHIKKPYQDEEGTRRGGYKEDTQRHWQGLDVLKRLRQQERHEIPELKGLLNQCRAA